MEKLLASLFSAEMKKLEVLIANLKTKERQVITLLFGIDQPRAYSPREIAHLMKESKERVRQLKNRAFEKLRSWLREGEEAIAVEPAEM